MIKFSSILGIVMLWTLLLLALTSGDESLTKVTTVKKVAIKEKMAVKKEDIDKADKMTKEQLEEIGRKVDSMDDEQLSTVLDAVLMPESKSYVSRRYRRTLGTVRRCIEKVRCLFGGLRRQRQLKEAAAAAAEAETETETRRRRRRKRASSPAAILRAISKLTGLASSAANELGNRLGLSGGSSDFGLASLFRDTQSSAASASSAAASDIDSSDSVTESDDTNVAEASEIVQESVCDQRCQLSVLVYRRLRRLLTRL